MVGVLPGAAGVVLQTCASGVLLKHVVFCSEKPPKQRLPVFQNHSPTSAPCLDSIHNVRGNFNIYTHRHGSSGA